VLREGTTLSVISWGAMVERCREGLIKHGISADLLDFADPVALGS